MSISFISKAFLAVAIYAGATAVACEACADGHEEAHGQNAAQIRELGVCYAEGKNGKEVNEAKAIELYEIAAEAGDATAARWLGWRYREGRGVSKDREKSNYYFSLAAAAGDEAALKALDNLAPEQVAGKTLYFFIEEKEIKNPPPSEYQNTHVFLSDGTRCLERTWQTGNTESGNIQSAEGKGYIKTSTVYRKTDKNRATVIYTFESSRGDGSTKRYTQTFKLVFTSPTLGYATCTITGAPTTIWASEIICKGHFSLLERSRN